MAGESVPVTLRHIARVRELLGSFAIEMIRRGDRHDASKFDPEEQGPLDRLQVMVDIQGNVEYGTPEYKARTALLGPMLQHHYAHNSHHPQHYPDGVNGMDLFDLVEMFYDWKAASERNGSVAFDIASGCCAHGVSDQVQRIFENTARRLGWNLKEDA